MRHWLVVALVGVAGCGAGQEQADARRFPSSGWDETLIVAPDPLSDILSAPTNLVAADGELIVLDGAPPHVRKFDREGRLLWASGARGEGPGEFDSPTALTALSGGRVGILDAGLGRATVLDSDGQPDGVIRLPREAHGLDMTSSGDTLRVAASYPPATAFVPLADPDALVTRPIAWADTFPGYARLHSVIGGSQAAWVTALKAGPGFFVHTPDSTLFVEYVEPHPVQLGNVRSDEVLLSAHSVEVRGDSVYVLYGGRTVFPRGEGPRVIDVYGLDGSYSHSYRLPREVRKMILDDDAFIVLVDAPAPGVLRLVPR